jgi:hypothetical protein
MVNFRRAFCKSCSNGSFWYKLLDCHRYQSPPAPPIPDPPDDPVEPPIVWEERTLCATSWLKAGEWCIDKKIVAAVVGSPNSPCHIHTAPRIPVYVGAYDLMGATGDWKSFLRKCKSAGATGVRFFICYSWGGPQPTSPYKQVGTWKHENGDTFPLYRLSEWNKEFWDKLDDVLNNMRELNLTPWLVCEDFCSLKGDQHVKYFNPFYSSEEALSPATPGGVWGIQDGEVELNLSMRPYHKALYKKTLDALMGGGHLIEDANEGDVIGGTDNQMLAWFTWSNATLIECGATRARIVTTVGRNVNEIKAICGAYSPHGVGTAGQIA